MSRRMSDKTPGKRGCYNRPMTRTATYLPSLLLLISLALPSIGPLIDHHFAERQPGHKHLASLSYHTHAADGRHFHPSTLEGPGSSDPIDGGQPVMVYNFDSGPAVSVLAFNDDLAVRSIIDYEPASIVTFPPRAKVSMTGRSTAPPDQPPRRIL